MEFRKIKISQFFGRPDSKRDYGGGAGCVEVRTAHREDFVVSKVL